MYYCSMTNTTCTYCGSTDARFNLPARDGKGRIACCAAHVLTYRRGGN